MGFMWSDVFILAGTNAGVVMEKKNMPGDSSAIPLVRGRGIIKGVKPYELLPVATSLSVRSQWDGKLQYQTHRAGLSRNIIQSATKKGTHWFAIRKSPISSTRSKSELA
jgi:hypothetical protein